MVDSQLKRATNGGLQVGLALLGHLVGIDVLPLVLVTHAATGKDGHPEFGLAKSPIFHGLSFMHARGCLR